MKNVNENAKSFDANEEVLAKVNGGTDTSEFSEIFINTWKEMFGQSDGSFQFVCEECGTVIKDTDMGRFYDAVCSHQNGHTKNYFGNMMNGWNTYWNNQPETKR